MQWPFGKTRKVKCHDGTERIVFKNPDDAFPLIAKDWSTQFEATVRALRELQGSLTINLNKQIEGFFIQLDEANSSMLTHFRAIYLVYQTNPCKLDNYLATEIRKAIQRESILRKMQMETHKVALLKSQGLDERVLGQALTNAQARASKSDIEEEISSEFQKAQKHTSTWKEETQ